MAWVRALNGERGKHRLVAKALGALGDPAAVPWLITRMGDQALARGAGESFALITGVNLSDDKLDRSVPDGFEPVPNDDPAEPVVFPDPDEDLPWPESERVGRWWAENGGRFARGTRYLLGRPAADGEACEVARRHGYQRQRRAASFELAVLRAGTRLGTWRKRVGVRQEG